MRCPSLLPVMYAQAPAQPPNDLCGEQLGLLATVMHEGKQWEIRAEIQDEKDYTRL